LSVYGRASLGNLDPAHLRGAHEREVPFGTVTAWPSISTVTVPAPFHGLWMRILVISRVHGRLAPRRLYPPAKGFPEILMRLCTGTAAMPAQPAQQNPAHGLAQLIEQKPHVALAVNPLENRVDDSNPARRAVRHCVHLPQDSMAQNAIA